MKVSGKRAVVAVKNALSSVGLVRNSSMSGAEITGWTESFGDTGLSVKHEMGENWRTPTGNLDWHVVMSGKPHMHYRKWVEAQGEDGDTINLHEPTNPDVVIPRIREAFASLGIEVVDVRYAGAQTHWDDDVGFNVITKPPEWLAPSDLRNSPPRVDVPVLTAFERGSDGFGVTVGTLVGYVHEGRSYLTRESLEAISTAFDKARQDDADFDAKYPSSRKRQRPTVAVDGDNLVVSDPERSLRWRTDVQSTTFENAWGDEVQCWQVPTHLVAVSYVFAPSVPFVAGGETRTSMSFAEHDSQFGPSPWFVELAPAKSPAP